jgi:hypothetical protein
VHSSSLRLRNRLVVAGLLGLFVLVGGLTYFKSVLLKRRQGDLGCYLRAGWAIRQGGRPLYRVLCDNQWHYNYPPLFAILVSTLADPPLKDGSLTAAAILGTAGSPNGALLASCVAAGSPAPHYPSGPYYLPYRFSVLVFYAVSVLLLVLAIALLGGALDRAYPLPANAVSAWWRYWIWRLGPVLICLPVLGLTLVRGQVQTLLLLLLSGVIVGLLHGRRLTAGMCIGGAVCLKLFPAYLVVLPLWRRDLRCLVGLGAAVVVGLAVIPTLVLGPRMTFAVYKDYADVLILPGLGMGGSSSRAEELTDATATQSQAFQVILHKTVHVMDARVPRTPAPWMKLAHWSLGAVLTLATLLFLGMHQGNTLAQMAGVSMLALVMVMLSPVCHLHYFTVGLPAIMALWARFDLPNSIVQRCAIGALFTALMLAWSVPMIPGAGVLRDVGVPMYAGLALWLTGLLTRWTPPAKQAGSGAREGRLAA